MQKLLMANQRQKGKKLRTFWVSQQEDQILIMLATRVKMTVSEFLRRPIDEEMKRYPHKYPLNE